MVELMAETGFSKVQDIEQMLMYETAQNNPSLERSVYHHVV